jgi:hypothetical protein
MKLIVLVSFIFFGLTSVANTNFAVTESFVSSSQKLSGDLIWNQSTGHLHPKLEVRGATGVPNTEI